MHTIRFSFAYGIYLSILSFRSKGKDRKVYPVGKRKAYGVHRELAEEEVHELRKKGDRARLIETNRNKKLYAAYEGVTPVQSGQNAQTMKNEETKKIPPKRMTYKEAYEKMPLVPINLRIGGEPRKGSVYAAVITGTDPKYGLKREFLKGERTYSGKNDVTMDYSAKLKPGTIIETGEGGSWKNSWGNYYIVTTDGLKLFKSNYQGKGKLEIKDIMKARENAMSKASSQS